MRLGPTVLLHLPLCPERAHSNQVIAAPEQCGCRSEQRAISGYPCGACWPLPGQLRGCSARAQAAAGTVLAHTADDAPAGAGGMPEGMCQVYAAELLASVAMTTVTAASHPGR